MPWNIPPEEVLIDDERTAKLLSKVDQWEAIQGRPSTHMGLVARRLKGKYKVRTYVHTYVGPKGQRSHATYR